MAGAVSLPGLLGLLFVSALPGVLGERPGADHRAHAGATEIRRRPSAREQRERPRAEALPWGALYTAAVVAFVLYKCLQRKEEAAVLQEEAGKKASRQSEQQLAQLTQQLDQTEQHLNSLMAQLDPLFERVTTLAGAQQELLNTKLRTFQQLLREKQAEERGTPLEPEAGIPSPEDLNVAEDQEEAGDSQVLEDPTTWSSNTWSLATPQEVAQGLRRRRSQVAANSPEGAGTEGLLKHRLFL